MPRNVLIDIIGRDNASRAFESAAASAERAGRRMDTVGARMSRTGASMTRSITLPVVAVAAVAVKQAADFQKSMTLLQTAGGELQKNMGVVSAGIKKIAVGTGTSLKDLSEGMYTVEKAGLRGSAGLNVLRIAAQGAKAENVDMGTSVSALTSVMMSYHYSAADAVKVQNMLVAGSGLAKTSMQEYAGSLSAVVPLAASLHISFSQVAGAIATMTQHGETAAESTQNLANLISSLAGQNNVASGAMQQLGIDTVDLQKNLGKRGLVGTLGIVEKALAKSTKGGMVVVSAFKQAQVATKSLHTEIAAMPKPLAELSSKLLIGKATRADYLKSIRGMSLENQTLGRNFLLTANQVFGFNAMLKAGKGDVGTAAAQLQKMLGGVTGMRVALQLGGESAGYFAKSADTVAKAGQNAGKNISTWQKTQSTLAVQADKAKEKLQVFAENIGEKLIPVVSKLVGWVSKAVDWFSGLSPATQDFMEKAALFAAALGPVLAVIGRVGSLIGGVIRLGSGLGSMIGNIRTMGTTARTAVSGMAGMDLGLVVGAMTRNSSTGVKLMGALGSAGAGAAVGFAMGGPWGAALGGVMGGLSSLATAFLGTGDSATAAGKAAAAALEIQNSAAGTLLETLKSVNGQYTTTTRAAVATQLQNTHVNGKGSPDVLSAAYSFGVTGGDLTAAALGDDAALRRVQNTLLNVKGSAGDLAVKTLEAFSNIAIGSGKAETRFEQFNAAAGRSLVTFAQFQGGAKALAAEFKGSGTALDDLSAYGRRNTEVLHENVDWINKSVKSQLAHGRTVQQVTQWMAGQAGAIKFTTSNLGFNADAVQAVIDKYKLTPHQVITDVIANTKPGASAIKTFQGIVDAIKQNKIPGVTANTQEAQDLIDQLQAKIDAMRGKTINITTLSTTKYGYAYASPSGDVSLPGTHHAAGGTVRDGWFTSGERGWELGHKHGSKVEFFSNRDSQKMTGWNRVPGFATGTTNAQRLTTATTDVFGIRDAVLPANIPQIATAMHQLLADLGSAVSHKVIDNLWASERKLYGIQQQRTAISEKLTAAESKLSSLQSSAASARSGVYQGFMGSFDIATAGQVYGDQPASPGGILAAITKTAADAKAFAAILARLRAKGLGPMLLQQLAQAGPAAIGQARALDAATPAMIQAITTQYRSLGGAGVWAGGTVASSMYGAGISAAQGLVDGLKKQSGALAAAVAGLVASMLSALRGSLSVPHHATGGVTLAPHLAFVGDNRSRNELIAPLDDPRARKLIGAAAADNGRQSKGGDTYNFYGLQDPDAIGLAVARRNNRIGVA